MVPKLDLYHVLFVLFPQPDKTDFSFLYIVLLPVMETLWSNNLLLYLTTIVSKRHLVHNHIVIGSHPRLVEPLPDADQC